jgi:hypothetical protein
MARDDPSHLEEARMFQHCWPLWHIPAEPKMHIFSATTNCMDSLAKDITSIKSFLGCSESIHISTSNFCVDIELPYSEVYAGLDKLFRQSRSPEHDLLFYRHFRVSVMFFVDRLYPRLDDTELPWN